MGPTSETRLAGGSGRPAPEGKVQKVREFRQRAKECREFAAKASNADLKKHYEELATVWEKLAKERLAFFVEHPEADADGELAADKADGLNGTEA